MEPIFGAGYGWRLGFKPAYVWSRPEGRNPLRWQQSMFRFGTVQQSQVRHRPRVIESLSFFHPFMNKGFGPEQCIVEATETWVASE
jgi:hypothetical protein